MHRSISEGEAPNEKSSPLSLSRLYGGGHKKSARPATADPAAKGPAEGKEGSVSRDAKAREHDPQLLRKRTSSTPNGEGAGRANGGGAVGALRPGQSILEQIGEPDHNGWMRKKGDRYNSWKLRYFVLKGPHLYWLRSNSKVVRSVLFFDGLKG